MSSPKENTGVLGSDYTTEDTLELLLGVSQGLAMENHGGRFPTAEEQTAAVIALTKIKVEMKKKGLNHWLLE